MTDAGYTPTHEHPQHRKPGLFDALDDGAHLIIRSTGGLSLRFACPIPECREPLQEDISAASLSVGILPAICEARGIPISDEREPNLHEEFGL